VDEDVDTKLPPPPAGNPNDDIELKLQSQRIMTSAAASHFSARINEQLPDGSPMTLHAAQYYWINNAITNLLINKNMKS